MRVYITDVIFKSRSEEIPDECPHCKTSLATPSSLKVEGYKKAQWEGNGRPREQLPCQLSIYNPAPLMKDDEADLVPLNIISCASCDKLLSHGSISVECEAKPIRN